MAKELAADKWFWPTGLVIHRCLMLK